MTVEFNNTDDRDSNGNVKFKDKEQPFQNSDNPIIDRRKSRLHNKLRTKTEEFQCRSCKHKIVKLNTERLRIKFLHKSENGRLSKKCHVHECNCNIPSISYT